MHRGLVSCPPSATLAEVAMALTERRTHTALVALESGLAFVTDMSIVTAAARGDGDALAGELVTSGLARVRADATLDVAAAFVAESPVGHVVAVDVDGFPVGVVSTLDLLGAVDPS
jgi:predicted transcriptional regulator